VENRSKYFLKIYFNQSDSELLKILHEVNEFKCQFAAVIQMNLLLEDHVIVLCVFYHNGNNRLYLL